MVVHLAPEQESHLADLLQPHAAIPVGHDFHSRGLTDLRLPAELETILYRVVQEGLTNILKHAEATHVSLILERRDGVIRAILEDDGAGFDVEETLDRPEKARRLGLRGMKERLALLGGELQIESSPGSGTTFFARLPHPTATPPRASRASMAPPPRSGSCAGAGTSR